MTNRAKRETSDADELIVLLRIVLICVAVLLSRDTLDTIMHYFLNEIFQLGFKRKRDMFYGRNFCSSFTMKNIDKITTVIQVHTWKPPVKQA